jgi:hypothetical protein
MVAHVWKLVNSTGQEISQFVRNRKELATCLYFEQRNSVIFQTNRVLGAFLLLRSADENPSLRPLLRPSVHIPVYIKHEPFGRMDIKSDFEKFYEKKSSHFNVG